jgi:hypothetical protein
VFKYLSLHSQSALSIKIINKNSWRLSTFYYMLEKLKWEKNNVDPKMKLTVNLIIVCVILTGTSSSSGKIQIDSFFYLSKANNKRFFKFKMQL